MTTTNGNGRSNSESDGGGTVDGNDDENIGRMLSLDEFVAHCEPIAGSLKPDVSVAARGPGGRPFGSRLGKVPLLPLATLEDRLNAEFTGPQPIVIRVAPKTGRGWAAQGEHEVPPPRPSTNNDALLQMLIDERKELRAEVKALNERLVSMTTAAAVPRETDKDRVDTLKSYADVVERMRPAQPATPATAQKTLVEQLEEADTVAQKLGFERPTKNAAAAAGESVMKHAISTFGESINDFVRLIGEGVKTKMLTEIQEKNEKKESGT
jgi:hypothetical protein